MKHTDIINTASKMAEIMPKEVNGSDRADIFVYLAIEIGLTHLLMPEAVPTSGHQIQLPEIAPEFYQKRSDRRERPCEFIRRVYKKWHGKGLARHHLLELDKPLYHALCCWLIKNEMPDWLNLPTKKELNDRELEKLGLEGGQSLPYPSYYTGLKDKLRLYNAARNRKGSEIQNLNSK